MLIRPSEMSAYSGLKTLLSFVLLGIIVAVLAGLVCLSHRSREERVMMSQIQSVAEMKSTELFLWQYLTLYPLEQIQKSRVVQVAIQRQLTI